MTPTTAPIDRHMEDIREICKLLDPEHKIQVSKTEVADFWERAIGTHRNLDRCFGRE